MYILAGVFFLAGRGLYHATPVPFTDFDFKNQNKYTTIKISTRLFSCTYFVVFKIKISKRQNKYTTKLILIFKNQ